MRPILSTMPLLVTAFAASALAQDAPFKVCQST